MSKFKDLIKVYGDISDLVRLGQNNDGGYVVNKSALTDSEILYTYGVGWTYEFEKQYCNMFKDNKVFMYDPTIEPLENLEKNIEFYQLGLHGYSEGKTSFNAHLNTNGHHNKRIFLKIDVEGSEYDFFRFVTMDTLENVTGMAIEFHNLQNNLSNMLHILDKLKQLFLVTHIHGNNHTSMLIIDNDYPFPSTAEISLINKKLLKVEKSVTRNYPLMGLDFPNATSLPDQEFKIYE